MYSKVLVTQTRTHGGPGYVVPLLQGASTSSTHILTFLDLLRLELLPVAILSLEEAEPEWETKRLPFASQSLV